MLLVLPTCERMHSHQSLQGAASSKAAAKHCQ